MKIFLFFLFLASPRDFSSPPLLDSNATRKTDEFSRRKILPFLFLFLVQNAEKKNHSTEIFSHSENFPLCVIAMSKPKLLVHALHEHAEKLKQNFPAVKHTRKNWVIALRILRTRRHTQRKALDSYLSQLRFCCDEDDDSPLGRQVFTSSSKCEQREKNFVQSKQRKFVSRSLLASKQTNKRTNERTKETNAERKVSLCVINRACVAQYLFLWDEMMHAAERKV